MMHHFVVVGTFSTSMREGKRNISFRVSVISIRQ